LLWRAKIKNLSGLIVSIKTQNGSILKWFAIFFAVIVISLVGTGYYQYNKLSASLPDVTTLHDVRYEMPLSIYSKDKVLMAQFGGNKRIPVKIEDVPKTFVNAFVAAEDDAFFEHPGVDYKGLIRAGIQLLLTGKKKQGGSTITMQVTRNFLLTNEKTYTRKLKEIILALKIEREYPKNKILELYLNQIYMGHSAYGIAAAAQTYYGKSLQNLTLAEQAMIAGLPKAPSAYNPITNQDRAIDRRNYVLQRMLELKYISQSDFDAASNEASTAKLQYHSSDIAVPYIAEMVRQFAYEKYSEDAYTLGLKIYTTIDPALQKAADHALWNSLHAYDERHGYRTKKPIAVDGKEILPSTAAIIGDTLAATVTSIGDNSLEAKLYNGKAIEIPWKKSKWAAARAQKYLSKNDPIRVRPSKTGIWMLSQVPEVEGAFVSMDPSNGAVLALVGGFEFNQNKFNRAIQAKRQPGSGFKPIIYTTALEQGYTAASLINDAPLAIYDPSLGRIWKPENSTKKFYGPTSIRK
jgi:penicillin-binding protein 1A